MMSYSGLLVSALTIILLGYIFIKSSGTKPPGPRRLPLIGNALQMPKETPWRTFSKWKKYYGDIIQVDVLGKPMLIINTRDVARDLIDKRSAIYSDRPRSIMAGELCGFNETFVLKPYGDDWRNQRKVIAHDFGQSMAPRYYPLQEKQACRLIKNVMKNPHSLVPQIKLQIGTIIVRVTYGYFLKDGEDPFLVTALQSMANFNEATTLGNFMVELIPALKHLPLWMPGSGFLQTAAKWKKLTMKSIWDPYLWTKKNLETGKTLLPSLCGSLLQESGGELPKEQEHHVVYAAGSILGGGLDTNMSTALTFFLAMLLHPDVQRKAQAEINAVVGMERLPTVSDKAELPYIRSIVTEVIRWNPALPFGLPHSLTKDDYYNGFILHKNTTVIVNLWHMLHDPEDFPNPEVFNPDRYKNEDNEMQRVIDIAFGFGRRACPGYHFGMGTLFAIVLTTLATCDILPALDGNGKEIIPEVKYTSGIISNPPPFRLRLIPRSQRAETLLNEAVLESH